MTGRSQAQWVASGVVAATVERVWDEVLATMPGLPAADKHTGARARYRVQAGSKGAGWISFDIDAQHHLIAVEGAWWYHGEYAVTAHARGSLVTYSVTNIAPGIGWWAAQFVQGPGHARDMRRQLAQRLDQPPARLRGVSCAITLGDHSGRH